MRLRFLSGNAVSNLLPEASRAVGDSQQCHENAANGTVDEALIDLHRSLLERLLVPQRALDQTWTPDRKPLHRPSQVR
jgi:hypothetical protein